MFVIWGYKTREEDGGIVGDWCETCRCATGNRLTKYFRVATIYFVPIGNGDHVATNRTCTECKAVVPCSPLAYVHILSQNQAAGRDFDDILRTTNPPLFERVREQRALESGLAQRAAQGNYPVFDMPGGIPVAPPPDTRVLPALQLLGTLNAQDNGVIHLKQRLQGWDSLLPVERDTLVREIDRYQAEDRKFKAVIQCLQGLPQPTPHGIGVVGFLFSLLAFVLGGIYLPFFQSGPTAALLAVVVIALWYFGHRSVTNLCVQHWIATRLIPRMKQRTVDSEYFIRMLKDVKRSPQGHSRTMLGYAGQAEAISVALTKRGMISTSAEPLVTQPAE